MYPTYPGLLVWGDGEVRAVGHELRGDDGREGAAHPIADLQTVHRGDGCSHTVRLVTCCQHPPTHVHFQCCKTLSISNLTAFLAVVSTGRTF